MPKCHAGLRQALDKAADPAKYLSHRHRDATHLTYTHEPHRGASRVGGSEGLDVRVVFQRYLRNG